jgi:hypothetical protein
MEDSLKASLTLKMLREHLEYREQNFELHKNFTETRKTSTGLFGRTICIDDSRQLWYIADCGNEPIFHFDELVSFTLLEDSNILERGSARGIDTFPSIIDGLWKGNFANTMQQFGTALPSFSMNRGQGNNNSHEQRMEPPVHIVWLEIEIDNIYWKKFRLRFDSPSIVDNDFNRFVMEYKRFLAEVDRLIQAIATLFPQQTVYNSKVNYR